MPGRIKSVKDYESVRNCVTPHNIIYAAQSRLYDDPDCAHYDEIIRWDARFGHILRTAKFLRISYDYLVGNSRIIVGPYSGQNKIIGGKYSGQL